MKPTANCCDFCDFVVVRPGNQKWDKRYVALRDNCVIVLEKETTGRGNVLDEFDLCPPDGVVVVHSAVTPAELSSTQPADIPYIFR